MSIYLSAKNNQQEYPYQLKTINKKIIISFIPLIPDYNFGMSCNFQI